MTSSIFDNIFNAALKVSQNQGVTNLDPTTVSFYYDPKESLILTNINLQTKLQQLIQLMNQFVDIAINSPFLKTQATSIKLNQNHMDTDLLEQHLNDKRLVQYFNSSLIRIDIIKVSDMLNPMSKLPAGNQFVIEIATLDQLNLAQLDNLDTNQIPIDQLNHLVTFKPILKYGTRLDDNHLNSYRLDSIMDVNQLEPLDMAIKSDFKANQKRAKDFASHRQFKAVNGGYLTKLDAKYKGKTDYYQLKNKLDELSSLNYFGPMYFLKQLREKISTVN